MLRFFKHVFAISTGAITLSLMISFTSLAAGDAPALTLKSGSKLYSRKEVTSQISTAKQLSSYANLKNAMATAQGNALVVSVKSVLNDSGLTNAGREKLAMDFLLAARKLEPSAALKSYVETFLTYDNKVFVMHEEGPLPLAYFNIAGAAQGTLFKWQRQEFKREAAAALKSNPGSVLGAFSESADKARAAGALDALNEASVDDLLKVLPGIQSQIAKNPSLIEPLVVIAQRTKRADLYESALVQGKSPSVLKLLAEVPEKFDGDTAFQLLSAASSNNDKLASAAVLQMHKLPAHSLNHKFVLDQLASKANGSSYAALIAKMNDTSLLQSAGARLLDSSSAENVVINAALALRLNGSALARAELARFVESDTSNKELAHVKEEVASWLSN